MDISGHKMDGTCMWLTKLEQDTKRCDSGILSLFSFTDGKRIKFQIWDTAGQERWEMTDILKIMFAEKIVRHLVSRVIPSLSVGSFKREWFNYLVPRVSILEWRNHHWFTRQIHLAGYVVEKQQKQKQNTLLLLVISPLRSYRKFLWALVLGTT